MRRGGLFFFPGQRVNGRPPSLCDRSVKYFVLPLYPPGRGNKGLCDSRDDQTTARRFLPRSLSLFEEDVSALWATGGRLIEIAFNLSATLVERGCAHGDYIEIRRRRWSSAREREREKRSFRGVCPPTVSFNGRWDD